MEISLYSQCDEESGFVEQSVRGAMGPRELHFGGTTYLSVGDFLYVPWNSMAECLDRHVEGTESARRARGRANLGQVRPRRALYDSYMRQVTRDDDGNIGFRSSESESGEIKLRVEEPLCESAPIMSKSVVDAYNS
ncbi:hypothetical protein AG1IA_02363 [Rhizoctonia solani AG-1 IA]|uniref:Uncharacterized protein n=1 Tax=Thanatephorus cucumeris (strain AG1-IA) TaxID=983506 RepID=L8X065_THACA|nr:hypothetical protein AG1IA_02363 [Rhizoctonia solani AG-1 IA]